MFKGRGHARVRCVIELGHYRKQAFVDNHRGATISLSL